MIVRLNDERCAAVLEHVLKHGSTTFVGDVSVQLCVTDDGGVYAICDRVTPAVQAFLARLEGPGQPPRGGKTATKKESKDKSNPGGAANSVDAGCQAEAASDPGAAHKKDRFGQSGRSLSRPADGAGVSAVSHGHGGRGPEKNNCDQNLSRTESARADACARAWRGGKPTGRVDASDDASSDVSNDLSLETSFVQLPGGEGDRREDEGALAEISAPSSEESLDDESSNDDERGCGFGFGRISVAFVDKGRSGNFLKLDRLNISEEDRLRARRALTTIMLRGGEMDAGPRWQSTKVASKTAGYLRPWSVADRREEDGLPPLLLLLDVSGSMSGVCRPLAEVILSLADELPTNSVVVIHSNGFLEAIVEREGKQRYREVRRWSHLRTDYRQEHTAALLRLCEASGIEKCVAAGDDDAEVLYRAMARRGMKVYWLHPAYSRHRQPFERPSGEWNLRLVYAAGKRTFIPALELVAQES